MKKVLVSRVDGTKLFEIKAGVTDKTIMEVLTNNGWSATIKHREFHLAECGREGWYYKVDRRGWVGVPCVVSGKAVYQIHNGRFVIGHRGQRFSISRRFAELGIELVAYGNSVMECRKMLIDANKMITENSVLA